MRFNLFIFNVLCASLLCLNSQVLASDTLFFRRNIKIFPVIEGGHIGYEYALPVKNGRIASIQGSLIFRKNDLFSLQNGSENYREKVMNLEYRQYLKRNNAQMSGLFHGFAIHASHFDGTVSSFMLDEQTSFFDIMPVWGRSISAGYLFGYQKMTRSGFNVDFGYVMRMQKSAGYDFEAYWLDLIPYRPYVSGLRSQVFLGLGLAF